jgi:serine/threonine protein kinase
VLVHRDMLLDGKYEVGDLIGSGGMGDVYCAEQRDLERTVAVKMLRADLQADPSMRQRFRTEAMVGSRIRHPNVVAVYDYGEHDGAPFLVMEHVRGARLSAVLAAKTPLSLQRALTFACDILAGLAEAHAEGIVHADVKSDNVMIGRYRDGTEVAKLLDFGLARPISTAPCTATTETFVSGTPEYLSPETIRGVRPSPASDVYSAGIVLYELLTGGTPFHGGAIAEVLRRHLEEDVVPPSVRCQERHITCAIDAVVMRALAKDPGERFADAEAFHRALVAAIPCEDPLARPDAELLLATETTHHDLRPIQARLARGSGLLTPRTTNDVRRGLGAAIASGQLSQIVAGYLDLARLHIDNSDHKAAANELEEAIDVLTVGEGAQTASPPEPLWRVLLPLASIYARLGDHGRALSILETGRKVAECHHSSVGTERARRLRDLLCGP